jgi:UDP-N-acetylmuramyl pentapeptide synthase
LSEGETTGHLVADSTEALKFVEHFSAGDVLLIKASRAEHLDLLTENIISALRSSGVVN